MNNGIPPVSDHELHAYVDGELDQRRRLEVETWLAAHPAEAARVRDYRLLETGLHARFDGILAEPVEEPAGRIHHRRTVLARVAVVVFLMLASGTTGWLLRDRPPGNAPGVALTDLVRPATFAHQVYSTDTRYPVEIPAAEQASLNRWVSQRMHTELRAPDLMAQGLRMIGGRLLPSTNRMAAQFMYEDHQGRRLTIYVRRITGQENAGDFRYLDQDGLHVFYWVDQAMGYAVIGEQPASVLIAIANAVHEAMNPAGGSRSGLRVEQG